MKKPIIFSLILLLCLHLNAQKKIRQPVDSVGFATSAWQMDSIVNRIDKIYRTSLDSVKRRNLFGQNTSFRLAICPHDDYTYAGSLYESVLPYIKAKTVIIFGVAHKAKKFNIEQRLVFDSFDEWKEPYGNIKISSLRAAILKNLPQEDYLIHDSLQQVEHSVEAIVPFLQYYNHDIQFIPILVPAMNFNLMKKISSDLAKAVSLVMNQNKLKWGKDIAVVISNDAVHYGDEEWGGKNNATYGCDKEGYDKAVNHENEIIRNSLVPLLDTVSIHKFFDYTVQSGNWREYLWPWCGRYSVPFGLLTGLYLSQIRGEEGLKGIKMRYSTSIARSPMPVEDLGMGKTAIATLHHWVGYAAIGCK
ncbi:MAG: AmmeMemoRadiSam system protein B [Bacteroidia bacterium]|nr:AmmeMemoRadiSam system protein B [Bacteroidia bacterium]